MVLKSDAVSNCIYQLQLRQVKLLSIIPIVKEAVLLPGKCVPRAHFYVWRIYKYISFILKQFHDEIVFDAR